MENAQPRLLFANAFEFFLVLLLVQELPGFLVAPGPVLFAYAALWPACICRQTSIARQATAAAQSLSPITRPVRDVPVGVVNDQRQTPVPSSSTRY
jgi:hypothetical protein